MAQRLLWGVWLTLAVAPAGVGAGVLLACSVGWGIASASVAYFIAAVYAAQSDSLLPDADAPREVER